jgi:hypothetical protein
MNKRCVVTAFVLLVLAALACNRTAPTATPPLETPTPTIPTGTGTATVATQEPVASASPTSAGATLTPAGATPTQTTPACAYDAEFVSDVTIPDDTEFEPDTDFAKTWRIRNSGTCAWEPGTQWYFESGEQMDGPDTVSVPATEPDTTADITVNLTAPEKPGSYTGYWRMRRPDDQAFGARSFVRIVVLGGTATGTPSASATPTATSQPGAGPSIQYFRSDVKEADPGDKITLEWEAEDASDATLYHLLPTGQLGTFWEVEVEGDFDYDIGVTERNHTDFLLIVSDDEGRTARASLSIPLRCPDTWFFEPAPSECPAAPAIVSAGAEQHFEHGTMIWIETEGQIYVLFDDAHSPYWSAYADEWDAGEPEQDPILTPPAGRYQPVRGFGLVWRERPGVRDRLGWAIDPETSFTTHMQRTSRPKYNDIYIDALDDKTWKLLPESSGWEKVPK